MKSSKPKSEYAKKQGRARKAAGDRADGPRTRYAAGSPFSAENKINPEHRLARYATRADLADRLLGRALDGDREARRLLRAMGI